MNKNVTNVDLERYISPKFRLTSTLYQSMTDVLEMERFSKKISKSNLSRELGVSRKEYDKLISCKVYLGYKNYLTILRLLGLVAEFKKTTGTDDFSVFGTDNLSEVIQRSRCLATHRLFAKTVDENVKHLILPELEDAFVLDNCIMDPSTATPCYETITLSEMLTFYEYKGYSLTLKKGV